MLMTSVANTVERRPGVRRHILDVAVAVIAAKGPKAATIADFIAAADIPHSTFLDCFPTTTDLLHALNSRITLEIDWGLEDARNTIDDPVDLLAAIMHRIWAAFAADPVKGWVALRLEGSTAPLQSVWREQFDVLYRRAVADGRFHLDDPLAARTLALGAFRMAIRQLHLGEVGLDHAHNLVVLLLTAFGLPRKEAIAVSLAQDVTGSVGDRAGRASH